MKYAIVDNQGVWTTVEADGWTRDRLGVHFYKFTGDTYRTWWQRIFKPSYHWEKQLVVFYIANDSLGSFRLDTPGDSA